MTTFDAVSTPRATAPISALRLSRLIINFMEARAKRAERRYTFKALSALDDRTLEDIGLTRGDLRTMR